MNEKLTASENVTFVKLLEMLPVEKKANIYGYEFENNNVEINVASSIVEDTSDIKLLFTLGSISKDKIFLTVTTGDDFEIGEQLAAIETSNLNNTAMGVGSTMKIINSYLLQHNKVESIVLPLNILNVFDDVEDDITVDDNNMDIYFIAFMSLEESTYYHENDYVELLNKFLHDDKDYLSV